MSSEKLAGKKAIVSGGSRGIGRGIALTLAAEGADVAFCHYKDDEKASQTVADIEALGRKAFAADCDVSSTSAIKDFYAASVNSIGDIDILVNNAGIATSAPIHEMTDEMWDELISIHLNATFYATTECLKVMYEQGYGRIINTASQLAYKGSPGFSHYTAAKGAIISFTRSLSLEIGKMNIRANCVAPGATMTRMLSEVPTEILDGIKASIPKGTIANIEEIVPAYVFLASDDGDHFVGQTISPNGGDHFL